MFRPDPFDDSENDEPLFALEQDPAHADLNQLAAQLADHMEGANPSELALDLVLNEIVQQARLATTASGAAIALFRKGEMVCRASSGSGAPELGTRLSTHDGLSGECWRTKQVQRCDDTQSDPRVDAAALGEWDVRSVLVVPIVSGEDLVGIFEILSARPKAFGDRDVLTLEALSRRIVRNLERLATGPAAQVAEVVKDAEVPAAPRQSPAEIPAEVPAARTLPAVRDYWTTILTGIVIALALLLGWMVGYAGWRQAVGTRETPPVAKASPPAAAEPSAAPVSAALVAPTPEKTKPVSRRRPAVEPPPPGGLLVTQNGKVVFELPANQTVASAVKPAGGNDSSNIMSLAPEVAETYLVRRVEPEYPTAARPSQALGPVVLEIRVGKDGAVRQASLISGDVLLVPAAEAAVRQWKYEPYSPDGTPQEFLTRVTVNFKHP